MAPLFNQQERAALPPKTIEGSAAVSYGRPINVNEHICLYEENRATTSITTLEKKRFLTFKPEEGVNVGIPRAPAQ